MSQDFEERALQLLHERKQLDAQYKQLESEFEAVTEISTQQQSLIESLQSQLREKERHLRHHTEQADLSEGLENELAMTKEALQRTKIELTTTKSELHHAIKLVRGHDRLNAVLDRHRAGSPAVLERQHSTERQDKRMADPRGARGRIGSLDPSKLSRKRFQKNKQPSVEEDPTLQVVLEIAQEARERNAARPSLAEFQQQQEEIKKLQDALDEERERAKQLAQEQERQEREARRASEQGGSSLADELGGASLADELGGASLADELSGLTGASHTESTQEQELMAEIEDLQGQMKALQAEHDQLLIQLAEVPQADSGDLDSLRQEIADLKQVEKDQAEIIERLQATAVSNRKQLRQALADAIAADKELMVVHEEKERLELELLKTKRELSALQTPRLRQQMQPPQQQRSDFSFLHQAPSLQPPTSTSDAPPMRQRAQTAAYGGGRRSQSLGALEEEPPEKPAKPDKPIKPAKPILGSPLMSPQGSPMGSPMTSRNEAAKTGLRRSLSVGAKRSPISTPIHQLALPRADSVSSPPEQQQREPAGIARSRLSSLFRRFEASKQNSN